MHNIWVFLLLFEFMNRDRNVKDERCFSCMVHDMEKSREYRYRSDEKMQLIVTKSELDDIEKRVSKGYAVKYQLPMIDSYVIEVQEEVLNILYRRRYAGRNSRGNAIVEMDSIITAQMKRAAPIIHLDAAHNKGIFGEGIGVAVLDTGVFPHPDLISGRNRIVAFHDVLNGRKYPYDDNGHGTHVLCY